MKIKTIVMAATLLLPAASLAGDHGTQGMHHDMSGGMEMRSGQPMFLEKAEVDGYTISFHVMPASGEMRHGGSSNLMVKVEHGGRLVDIAAINSKVIYPDGSSESKMMMKMGDWYMVGYDLDHQGSHQLMVLFKTADGTKHFVGVRYPAKGKE